MPDDVVMCEDCGENPATFTIEDLDENEEEPATIRLCRDCAANH